MQGVTETVTAVTEPGVPETGVGGAAALAEQLQREKQQKREANTQAQRNCRQRKRLAQQEDKAEGKREELDRKGFCVLPINFSKTIMKVCVCVRARAC